MVSRLRPGAPRAAIFSVLLAALAACADDAPPPSGSVAPALEYEIEAVYGPELIMGGQVYPITPIWRLGHSGMVRDGSGRIFFTQVMEGHVKVISPAGELVQTIGRSGDGPGEYRLPSRMGLTETGKLWIFDSGSFRVTTVGEDGSVDVTRRVPASPPPYRRISLYITQVWDDGTMLGYERIGSSAYIHEIRPKSRVWSVDDAGEIQGPLGAMDFKGLMHRIGTTTGDPNGSYLLEAIRTSAVVGALPLSRRGVLIEGYDPAAPDEVRLRIFSLNGAEAEELTYRREPIPIPETLVDSLVHDYSRGQVRMGRFATREEARRSIRDSLHLGTYWPAAQRIVPTHDGLLWIEVGKDARRRGIYERIGRLEDGTLHAQRVHVPPGVAVQVFGPDDAWGMTQDDFDQVLIVKLARVGPEPPPLEALVR